MKFTSALVIALAGVVVAKGNKNSTESQCAQVQKLTKLTEIAANQTLLEKASKDNATKAAEIQAKAATAATTLATLQSNTTLMTACDSIFAAEDTLDQCDEMASLEKVMEIANNQTLLDKATKNNATKAAAYQAKASAKAQTLADLQSNTTLTAACAVVNDKASCKTMAKLAKEQAMASNTTALVSFFSSLSFSLIQLLTSSYRTPSSTTMPPRSPTTRLRLARRPRSLPP